MKTSRSTMKTLVLGALLCSSILPLFAQDAPKPKAPVPTVPEVFTLMGQYVRVAYNNEGYVTLGYRTANASLGNEWMLLEIGLTVRSGADSVVLKRDAFSLETPDGKQIPLATQQEYRTGELRGMQTMANHLRDNISYFPGDVMRRCAISFYSDPDKRNLTYDQVELNRQGGCLGRHPSTPRSFAVIDSAVAPVFPVTSNTTTPIPLRSLKSVSSPLSWMIDAANLVERGPSLMPISRRSSTCAFRSMVASTPTGPRYVMQPAADNASADAAAILVADQIPVPQCDAMRPPPDPSS